MVLLVNVDDNDKLSVIKTARQLKHLVTSGDDLSYLFSILNQGLTHHSHIILGENVITKGIDVPIEDIVSAIGIFYKFKKKELPRIGIISMDISQVDKFKDDSIATVIPRPPIATLDETESVLLSFFSDKPCTFSKAFDRPNIMFPGIPVLTPQESKILCFIVNCGSSNKAIAKTMKCAESTIKMHMTSILKKFKVKNRTQLTVVVKSLGPH
jgi:DNA-binding CsgD family transcriptional regulator